MQIKSNQDILPGRLHAVIDWKPFIYGVQSKMESQRKPAQSRTGNQQFHDAKGVKYWIGCKLNGLEPGLFQDTAKV